MIHLEYFTRADFDQLIAWINSNQLMVQWSGPQFAYPLTNQQLEKYISKANYEDADSFVFKIIKLETGKVVGHISLGSIDRKNKSARVGKVLVGEESERGQGIAEKSVKEVLKIAFSSLHLHKVGLGVFDFNKSAIACYEKVGFVKDGVLRDHRKIGDTYWSLVEMSLLEDEWRLKK